MGCGSSRSLQVVEQDQNNVPQVSNNNSTTTKQPSETQTKTAKTPKKNVKVKKTSGTIETFTILWEELSPKPEVSLQEVCEFQPNNAMECWDAVRATSIKQENTVQPALKRRGWKTIRLFVSSTFKDFHAEREVLVKQVSNNFENIR